MPIDVLHRPSGPHSRWSRVNQAEARVGVQTPLSLTVWEAISERGYRHAFTRLGLLPPSALQVPPSADERFGSVFYGRGAVNIGVLRSALAAAPGGVVDAAEKGYFSSTTDTARRASAPSAARKAFVRVWMPLQVARTRRSLGQLRADSRSYWHRSLDELATADQAGATGVLRAAVDRAMAEMTCQIVMGTTISRVHRAIEDVVASAGRPELLLPLIGGFGETEDILIAAQLWEVSRGRRSLAGFVHEHGFHGPAQSELSSRSWREDPSPLEAMVQAYEAKGDGDDPRSLERRRSLERQEAQRALLGALRGRQRLQAEWALRQGRQLLPLREVPKAAFTQTFDVCRAAARVIGAHLAAAGAIDDPEDVFQLALGEVLAGGGGDLREVAAFRRGRRAEYQALDLPMSWTGMPEVVAAPQAPAPGQAPAGAPAEELADIAGLGVSPGVVEGTAHVALDAGDPAELPSDGILVCHTTDPSWASYFVLATAVVIDVGGMLSHGAIVARELGIPCVINTGTGTRQLRSGDRIRVDGTAGTVTVLHRSPRGALP